MRTVVLDSMWYGDLTADGASVASARDGSHVLLNGETFPVPPQHGGVLQIRISPDGQDFGGQPQTGTRCILFNGHWSELPDGPIGPNSLIFDAAGQPRVAIAGAHTPTGSLGYWYVADDGRLVPAAEVYGPTPSVPRLFLHTTHGGISVGQGDSGGVAAWVNGRLVKVADGDTEFVRFALAGDQIGLCWAEQKIPRVTFLWLTVAELAAMPDYPSASVPAPVPQPPNPEPPVSDISALLADRVDIVIAVKRDYPHLRGAAITDQVIHRLNRLYGTDRFGRKARNADGSNPNEDVVMVSVNRADARDNRLIDILRDGGGEDGPIWHVLPAEGSYGNGFWRPAVNPDLDGVPVPSPIPVPAPVPPVPQPPDPALLAAIKALEARVAKLEARPAVQSIDCLLIALESSRGRFLRDDHGDDIARFDRDDANEGETFTVRVKG